MADQNFEARLERLFAQSPHMGDDADFQARVDARLDFNWRWRNLTLGLAGAIGGSVAVAQALGSGAGLKLQAAGVSSARTVDQIYHEAARGGDLLLQTGASASLFWVASALLVVAAVFGATRILDDI